MVAGRAEHWIDADVDAVVGPQPAKVLGQMSLGDSTPALSAPIRYRLFANSRFTKT